VWAARLKVATRRHRESNLMLAGGARVMKVTAVVGNPKPKSRTADAAMRLAAAVTGSTPELLDLIELGPGLLGWDDLAVREAVSMVAASDLVVVASPTYKATYSGLLKLFLDQFSTGTGLAGVVGVPLMLGAGPAHALAPELHLKPVLVELGAICPAPGLYLLESAYADDDALAPWLSAWRPALSAVLDVRRAGSEANW
jgi:FMN reductase